MKVLVACEFSGRVRDAFRRLGHDAFSIDLLPTESSPDYHIQGDVRDYLGEQWDLLIAHPPCTYLAVSGRRWWKVKTQEQIEALEFVQLLLDAPIPRIAVENPVSLIASRIRRPDQIIQPWQFGHEDIKRTCLWLKNLPPLEPTQVSPIRIQRLRNLPATPFRWKIKSRTYRGIAEAMATQWGKLTDEYYEHSTAPRIYTNVMPQVRHTRQKIFSRVDI